ncbi:MAG: hypothetical protein ACRCVN_01140 [Spirochaetia bacterium]
MDEAGAEVFQQAIWVFKENYHWEQVTSLASSLERVVIEAEGSASTMLPDTLIKKDYGFVFSTYVTI